MLKDLKDIYLISDMERQARSIHKKNHIHMLQARALKYFPYQLNSNKVSGLKIELEEEAQSTYEEPFLIVMILNI